jgi:hypothetical protein
MHHPLPLPGFQAMGQRAGLAGLVARHRIVMGHLEALASDQVVRPPAVGPVGGIGRQDAVTAVAQDVGLGQGLQEGDQFGQGAEPMGHGGGFSGSFAAKYCHGGIWRSNRRPRSPIHF